MQCYSQSVALYPGEGWVGNLGDPFWSLVYISLYDPQPDPQNTFKNAIERLSALSNYAAACALRAAGHQFGVWGFERSPELAEQWLQTAAKRQNGREGFGFDLEEIPRMIWHAGLHPVACFLWQRLADLGRVDAASALYDVHRGWFNDTPEQYIDAHKADYWLKRSAEAGCKVSKYNLARDRMNNEDMHDPVARGGVEAADRRHGRGPDRRPRQSATGHFAAPLRRAGGPRTGPALPAVGIRP